MRRRQRWRRWRRWRTAAWRLGALTGLVALIAASGYGEARYRKPVAPRAVAVNLGVTADRARWQPTGGGSGQLVLERVSPRMTVMAVAPGRRAAALPTSVLRSSWRRLFAPSGGATNVMVSATVDGRELLVPARARLAPADGPGRALVLALSPLGPDRLPARPVLLDAPSVVVDPAVGPKQLALWRAIGEHFRPDEHTAAPPNPASTTPDGKTLVYRPGGVYAAAEARTSTSSTTDWQRVQAGVLDAAGIHRRTADLAELTFGDVHYDGLAIFGGPGFTSIELGTKLRVSEIESSAIFGVRVDRLWFTEARVGGLNMRGTEVGQLLVDRTLLRGVDMTGARLGGETAGAVNGSVLDRVSGNRFAQGPDGMADGLARPVRIFNTMFISSLIRDSSFPKADIDSVMFLNCGFIRVDFSGAQIVGADLARLDGRFQPSFGHSVLWDVRFDGALLRNVSFRGADFSGGVSLDGATLDNVDFTDAEGLQHVDWTRVKVAGPVYGLGEYSEQLALRDRAHLRGPTIDNAPARTDARTGFDVDARTGHLLDPHTGVRLERTASGELVPVDARGERLRDPLTRHLLLWDAPIGVFDPVTGDTFGVDRRGGGPVRPR